MRVSTTPCSTTGCHEKARISAMTSQDLDDRKRRTYASARCPNGHVATYRGELPVSRVIGLFRRTAALAQKYAR